MKEKNLEVEKMITIETRRIKRKRPFLEEVEVVYEKADRGSFISRVKAKTKNKVIVLKNEGRCLNASIRKLFSNLSRLMERKKYGRGNRITINFKEVA